MGGQAAGDRVRRMHFVLRTTKRLREGERPYIVGAHEALDSWSPAGGVAMAPITGLHSHEQEWEAVVALTEGDTSEFKFLPPPPPLRTKWTRRVPHPVLIGHAASLTPY